MIFPECCFLDATDCTKEKVMNSLMDNKYPTRICFSSCHKNSLVKNKKYGSGFISVPFKKTIGPMFERMTGLKLFPDKFNKYWRVIENDVEFQSIEDWVESVKNYVFIRDCLTLSMTLGEYVGDDDNRTYMGNFFYNAKYGQSKENIENIVEEIRLFLNKIPYYSNAKYVCAVPPSAEKIFDLPSILCNKLEEKCEVKNITNILKWVHPKKSLKNVELARKWDILEETTLNCASKMPSDEPIILLDDLYQSGITMQFVAKSLVDSGSKYVYGLSLVKSRRNTDNY